MIVCVKLICVVINGCLIILMNLHRALTTRIILTSNIAMKRYNDILIIFVTNLYYPSKTSQKSNAWYFTYFKILAWYIFLSKYRENCSCDERLRIQKNPKKQSCINDQKYYICLYSIKKLYFCCSINSNCCDICIWNIKL